MEEIKSISEAYLIQRSVKMTLLKRYIIEILKEDLDPVQAAAQYAHRGQTRRTGEPYIFHPYGVAKSVKQYYPDNKVAYDAALLHDTIEDSIELGNIKDEEEMISIIHDAIEDDNHAIEVVDVVLALTKMPGIEYMHYVESLFSFPNALIVKLADMNHNLGDNPSPHQKKKYSGAINKIIDGFGGKPNFIDNAHWQELLDKIK